MSTLADTGPLGSSGLQYGAMGLLALVLTAVFALLREIISRRDKTNDSLIAQLNTAHEAMSDKVLPALTQAAVAQAAAADMVKKVLERSAVLEDREHGRGGR